MVAMRMQNMIYISIGKLFYWKKNKKSDTTWTTLWCFTVCNLCAADVSLLNFFCLVFFFTIYIVI